jgi:hypothetical protein
MYPWLHKKKRNRRLHLSRWSPTRYVYSERRISLNHLRLEQNTTGTVVNSSQQIRNFSSTEALRFPRAFDLGLAPLRQITVNHPYSRPSTLTQTGAANMNVLVDGEDQEAVELCAQTTIRREPVEPVPTV